LIWHFTAQFNVYKREGVIIAEHKSAVAGIRTRDRKLGRLVS
jgi:hypothetical protein